MRALRSLVMFCAVAGFVAAAGAQAPSAPGAGDTFNTNTGPSEAAPLQGSVSANADPCQQAYRQAELQVVEAGTQADAQLKKDEIDCNGDQGCRQAAQQKSLAKQRQIADQNVDAQAQYSICRERAQAGTGQSAPPTSSVPSPPITGGVAKKKIPSSDVAKKQTPLSGVAKKKTPPTSTVPSRPLTSGTAKLPKGAVASGDPDASDKGAPGFLGSFPGTKSSWGSFCYTYLCESKLCQHDDGEVKRTLDLNFGCPLRVTNGSRDRSA
jgi:hypothetical protein